MAISDDTPVWRYQSLSAVFGTIRTRKLRLTRIDTFQDPFEGSVPFSHNDLQALLFGGMMNSIVPNHNAEMVKSSLPPDEDPWARVIRLRRARTRSAHASCWSIGEESEAIWRLYCHDSREGVGVAFQTTFARLKASVPDELRVDPITYIRYHEAPPFTDEIAHLLHKRHGLAAEKELRVLRFDQDHFNAQIPKGASVPELPEHFTLEWDVGSVIERIVISPYADERYESLVRVAIGAIDQKLAARIDLSELHERRNLTSSFRALKR